jgi:recombination protein RecR
MAGAEVERLIQALARLPGLGPRSGRRAALALLDKRDTLLRPLVEALAAADETVRPCSVCASLDSTDPCAICADARRDPSQLCVVEGVADVWALERAGVFRGRYHVLGGLLSPLDGIGPEDLNIAALVARANQPEATEVILALSATVDGQTTAHYVAERLGGCSVAVTRLAHGVPVGGELDYLDDGTLSAALKARQKL